MTFLYYYAGAILLILFGYLGFIIWHHYKYTDERGWHKCVNCGKAPSTVYYTVKWWGMVYQCGDCAFRKEVTND